MKTMLSSCQTMQQCMSRNQAHLQKHCQQKQRAAVNGLNRQSMNQVNLTTCLSWLVHLQQSTCLSRLCQRKLKMGVLESHRSQVLLMQLQRPTCPLNCCIRCQARPVLPMQLQRLTRLEKSRRCQARLELPTRQLPPAPAMHPRCRLQRLLSLTRELLRSPKFPRREPRQPASQRRSRKQRQSQRQRPKEKQKQKARPRRSRSRAKRKLRQLKAQTRNLRQRNSRWQMYRKSRWQMYQQQAPLGQKWHPQG
mmetsp:Transcript_88009/g.153839  ORF Transcript_88009/g.153839 Transcript_88009/m.153839 type:complete len:251 (+) Transcript_88009:1378-2130(+)